MMRIILLPFRLIWFLLELVLNLTGRLICAVLGLVFMVVGLILTATILGSVIGIPLFIFGVILLLRSIFI
ncbi:MAG: hypothetical protein FWE24_10785 [Defluviitaleaceae bacterium]|nr:hypothetical protein [Defluviitaleaceae bacterium]